MGPDKTSSRVRFALGAVVARPDRFFDAALFGDFFFEDFFFEALFFAEVFAEVPAAAFFREAFFVADFFAFFLLALLRETDFAAFLLPGFLLPDFLPPDFLPPDFLPPDFLPEDLATFFAGLRAAGLRRAADFFFDTFLVEDFFPVLLTLRFFPEALPIFLPTPALREVTPALEAPALFRFLLAAFLAGMFHSCRSEKNAELYIGCPDMEARNQGIRRAPAPRPRTPAQTSAGSEFGGPIERTGTGRATKVQRCELAIGCARRHDRVIVALNCLGAATIVLSGDIHYTTAI